MSVTTSGGRNRGKPMASNCRNAPVPFVSVRRTWSTESPISSPATGWARPRGGDEGTAAGALVVGARADEPVVVVLLEQVRGPPGDAGGRDHGGEQVHGGG